MEIFTIEELNRRRFLKSAVAAGVGAAGATSLLAFLDACGAGSQPTSGSGISATGPTATMKLSWGNTLTYSMGVLAIKFKELVEASTHNRLKVQLFPNAQLGTEVASLQGLQNGTIEGYAGTTSAAVATVPQLGILDLPYIWNSADHMYKVLDGSFGDSLKATAEKSGFHILSFNGYGWRDTFGNLHGIQTPADMKGLRLRVIQSPVYVAAFKAFGAVPTPLAFTEIYLAVKQGTIDGADGGFGGTVGIKLYEVVKYASLTHHAQSPGMFAVSKQWWDSLPKDLQQAIQQGATDATKVQRAQSVNENNVAQKTYEANGVTTVTADTKAFQAIAETVWPSFFTQYPKTDIDSIRKQA